jgi:N utilization substance protein A
MLSLGNKKDFLNLIDTVSNVQNLEKEEVKHALEEALATGIRKDFSKDTLLNVKINENGEAKLYRKWLIVDDNYLNFVDDSCVYEDIAQERFSPKLVIGDTYLKEVEDYSFKRVNVSIVRQLLKVKLQEAHKDRLKESLSHKRGQLISVNVKRYDREGYTVDYNSEISGFIPFSNLFSKSEKLKVGNNYFVVLDYDQEFKNHKIVFTKSNEEFVRNVFNREIPEVGDELIELKSMYHLEGRKILVAVHTSDKNIDPIGACVGYKGVRIQSISKHFNGEKVELIRWSGDDLEMILNILGEDCEENIQKLVISDFKTTVVFEEDYYNAVNEKEIQKILTKLLNKNIEIISSSDFSKRSQKENIIHIKYLQNEMNLDEDSVNYLVDLGFLSIDDIYNSDLEELIDSGLTKEDAISLKEVAEESVKIRIDFIAKSKTDLIDIDFLNDYMVDILLRSSINSKKVLADLSTFELTDLLPIEEEYAAKIVMEARKIWNLA